MNTKLSGAQVIKVPITTIGRNYFPFVENLHNRFIKFIDFAPAAYLPDTTASGVTSSQDMYITIMNEYGNSELMREMPLQYFDYTSTLGIRKPVMAKIGVNNCYIDCQNAAMVGKTALLVAWYDLPEFSQRNTTTKIMTDSASIVLTTDVRHNAFPQINRMVNKRFRRILLSAPAITPNGFTGVDYSKLQNLYVTLCRGSYNILDQVPLMLLYQIQMICKSEFQNINFDFQSSYITVGGQGTYPTFASDYEDKCVFVNLQYEV